MSGREDKATRTTWAPDKFDEPRQAAQPGFDERLEDAMDELHGAAVSESDRGWSGRGAEERVEAARQAIRSLVSELRK